MYAQDMPVSEWAFSSTIRIASHNAGSASRNTTAPHGNARFTGAGSSTRRAMIGGEA